MQKNLILIFLFVFFVSIIGCGVDYTKRIEYPENAQLEIIKGPYLQCVTKTSIVVMWETNKETPGKVDFGTSQTLGQTVQNDMKNAKPSFIHQIMLTNLKPETRYYYKVTSNDKSSEVNSFLTAVNENTPFRLGVWSDNSMFGKQHNQVVSLMGLYKPDVAINAGDFVHKGCDYWRWEREFFQPAKDFIKSTPFFSAIGNHDYRGYSGGDKEPGNPLKSVVNAGWYDEFFESPSIDTSKPTGDSKYYSFNYGCVHFICLDTGLDIKPGSQQYNWLVNDLKSEASQKATWRIAYHHHPVYSNVWGDYYEKPSDYSKIYGGEGVLKEHVKPLYEQYKVSMVFTGHAHAYECAIVNNVCYIVAGGSGGPLDAIQNNIKEVNLSVACHHFCILDISKDKISYGVYNMQNKPFQAIEITKDGVVTSKEKDKKPAPVTTPKKKAK